MNLNSFCVLFFAITVGAFAPTEASSVRDASSVPDAGVEASPGDIASLADQHQQNNDIIPVQKETPQGSLQQKKTRSASVLAKAGAAALVLAFVFLFIKGAEYMKAKEEEEEEVVLVEEAIQFEMRRIAEEIGFDAEAMTEQERRDEAEDRIKRRRKIYLEMRKDPAKEGKTKEELRKLAYKEEAWERYQSEDRQKFNKEFEDAWLEREIKFEMELVIGKEVVFKIEMMTEQKRRQEAKRRIKRRGEHFVEMIKDPANKGKTGDELRMLAHLEEAWERCQKRAERFDYTADREESDKEAREAWDDRLRKQAQGLGLGQL